MTVESLVESFRTPSILDPLKAKPRHKDDKKGQPGWSPGTFRDCRRSKPNVIAMYMVGLDFDNGAPSWSSLESYDGFGHTTYMHSPEAHRWRVCLRLSRPVDAGEYARIWKHFQNLSNANADEAAKDASRFWYLPIAHPDHAHEYEFRNLSGAPVDVEAVLSLSPPEGETFKGAPIIVSDGNDAPLTEGDLAAIKLLSEAWPPNGKRNEARFALIGGLLRNFTEAKTEAIVRALYKHLGEPKDSSAEIDRTSVKLAAGDQAVTGWPALKSHVAWERVDAFCRALGLPVPLPSTEDEKLKFGAAVSK